jgi:hypothetical protein
MCDVSLEVEHSGRAALLRSRSAQFSTLFVNYLIPDNRVLYAIRQDIRETSLA